MADALTKFKPLTSDDVYKGMDKTYSSAQVAYDTGLTWYYVERTGGTSSTSSDTMKNLFHSFGLSRKDYDTTIKAVNLSDWYNAKRMIIASIPQSACSSYIDGSTVILRVPTGVTNNAFVTLYGSTYNGYPDPAGTGKQLAKEYEDTSYGCAFCYLFGASNTPIGNGKLPSTAYSWAMPYTGLVNGKMNPNSGITTFDPDEVVASTSLATAHAAKSTHYAATPWNGTEGDAPYGIAFLEKGIFVVFDMWGRNDLIGNTAIGSDTVWVAQQPGFSAYTFTSTTATKNTDTANRKAISFSGATGQTNAALYYRTVDQSYKMIYFCHAGQNEFNSTSNHTYNNRRAYYRPEEASSVWISEVGLYDENDVMLAYAKLSEPIEKNKLETLTFKVELEL